MKSARTYHVFWLIFVAGWCSGGENRLFKQAGVTLKMTTGVKASFSGLGGFTSQSDPGPESGNANRQYDDGYNHIDNSENANGQTWNWGIEKESQISGDHILLHKTTAPGNLTLDAGSTIQPGIELFHYRPVGGVMGRVWGIKGAVSYTHLNVSETAVLFGESQTLTDAYGLDGVISPLPDYKGSYDGPGPLIESNPNRSIRLDADGQRVEGDWSLSGHQLQLDLGSYLDVYLIGRMGIRVGGGLSFASVSGTFDFNESVSIDGVGTQIHNGSSSETRLLVGGYLETAFAYNIRKRFNLTASIGYQRLDSLSFEADGKTGLLELEGTPTFTFGAELFF